MTKAPPSKIINLNGSSDRVLQLLTTVCAESALVITQGLLAFDSVSSDPIVLHLNSPGGCVLSGFSIIETMEMIHAPVFTIGAGVVASMAAIILCAGEPGFRYATHRARIMFHGGSGQSGGKLAQMQSALRLHSELERDMEEILLSRSKLSRSQLRRLLQEERYLSAQEALSSGFVDEIL